LFDIPSAYCSFGISKLDDDLAVDGIDEEVLELSIVPDEVAPLEPNDDRLLFRGILILLTF
jgi:hypothetical protein